MNRKIQPAKKTEIRKVHENLLSDSTIIDIISAFGRLAVTSYGPNGRLKFLHTHAGGHVTVTSSSTQIINHLMGTSHPVLRIILMAIKGHLEVFNDGGLTMAILITRLVESSLKLDIPRSVIVEVIIDAKEIITRYLTGLGSGKCKIKIDIGDIRTMLSVVQGLLGTKPACSLSDQEKEFLSTVLLKAFLQSVPAKSNSATRQNSFNPIQFLTCEGLPVTQTKVVNGVLLEAPDLPTYSRRTAVEHLKVALYNISMAGDTEEWTEGMATVAMGGLRREQLSDGILELMKSLVAVFVKEGVGLVACQKVIHPQLKTFLKEKGIYVIDRLSILHIGAVQRLSGAKIMSTFTKDVPAEWFGFVGSIEHNILNNKSYLHIQSGAKSSSSSAASLSSSSVTTLVLCAPNETSLSELKIVCQSVLSTLQGVISSPYLVPGGGCLETHLAWYLRYMARQCDGSKLEELCCTRAQYITVTDTIACCLETIAKSLDHDGGDHVTDLTNHHHWIFAPGEQPDNSDIPSCICGLVTREQCDSWCIMGNDNCYEAREERSFTCSSSQDRKLNNNILDLHISKVSLLQAAFETASIILRVKHLVSD